MKNSEEKKKLNPRLNMTPMIDVVFLLLIFFVVVIKQEDILSSLSAARPRPDDNPPPPKLELISVDISTAGFSLNKKPISKEALDKRLKTYAAIDNTATVVIRCTQDSPHGLLVQSLDICSKHGMSNVALFSK
jgi:biopolymer transport protein ExbD